MIADFLLAPALGSALVKFAFFISVFGVVISVWGAIARREDMRQSGRRAAFAVWGLIFYAVLCLERALILRDYSLEYVVEQIDASMPLVYRITSLWGGMNGSLLWWMLIAASFTGACLLVNRDRFRELMPWVTATCCYVLAFLGMLVAFFCNPFLPLAESDPALGFQQLLAQTGEGKGLNPLLQTYWMPIHPPSLYVGYIGFTIPFAFCIAALVTGRVDQEFLRATRRWTLLAWAILGFGILLGSKWAYEELGWGGYWGWDPVENASFMPWLAATAYVHSVIIQEKRGMLKGWNVFLILLTFLLTYFGTFLTRSGVVQSVHAFGSGPVGWLLGGFIASLTVLCVVLVAWRKNELSAENEIEAVLSREATFLYNNVGLLGFLVMVFVGTMFPVFSEAVYELSDGSIGNGKVVVGPPFFNPLAGLIVIGLLLLMGVGQLVAWRKTSNAALKRNFTVPLWVTVASFVLLAVLLPKDHRFLGLPWANPWALALFVSSVFVVAGIVWEYAIGTGAILSSHAKEIADRWESGDRLVAAFLIAVGVTVSILGWAIASVVLATAGTPLQVVFGAGLGVAAIFAVGTAGRSNRRVFETTFAMVILFARNRRRYGGYVTHLGLVFAVVGITASSLYKLDETHTFRTGDTKRVGEFDLTFTGVELRSESNRTSANGQPIVDRERLIAYLKMEKDGKKVGVGYPEKRFYPKQDQPTTEVAIHETALRDYYMILESYEVKNDAIAAVTIRVLQAPLVTWLWFGGVLLLAGTALAVWPAPRRSEVPAAASAPAAVGSGRLAEGTAAKEAL